MAVESPRKKKDSVNYFFTMDQKQKERWLLSDVLLDSRLPICCYRADVFSMKLPTTKKALNFKSYLVDCARNLFSEVEVIQTDNHIPQCEYKLGKLK